LSLALIKEYRSLNYETGHSIKDIWLVVLMARGTGQEGLGEEEGEVFKIILKISKTIFKIPPQ